MATTEETTREKPNFVSTAGVKSLYILSGSAALIAAIIFRRWLSAEYGLLSSMGLFRGGANQEPRTVFEWFKLLESNSFIGLLFLNAFDLINFLLVGLIFLGLFVALRNKFRLLMTFTLVIAFIGIGIFLATNQAFSILSLSRQYLSATTDAERTIILSAGQALLTINNPMTFGTGVFWAFIIVTFSGLLISISMLRSDVFPRITSYMGLLANAFGLGYFFTVAFSPSLTFIPLSASAPFLLIWYILVGIKMLKLSQCKGAVSRK